MIKSGPVINQIYSLLSEICEFNEFLCGNMSRKEYALWSVDFIKKSDLSGRDAHKVYLSTRMPCGEATLSSKLAPFDGEKAGDVAARFLNSLCPRQFIHNTHQTYIFPEEEHLLRRLVVKRKPRKIIFIGSYYGFWSASVMPIIKKIGAKVTLIDIDKKVLALSEKNAKLLGWDSSCVFVREDASEFLKGKESLFDLAVLDAEGPAEGPVRERLGKRIYDPLTRDIERWLKPDGALIAHNIMLADISETSYTESLVQKHHEELAPFLSHMDYFFEDHEFLETTEGVGIWVNHPND